MTGSLAAGTSAGPVHDRGARMSLAAARRTARTYRGASAWTRAYVWARIAVAPLGPIGDELASVRGDLLSLGCGAAVIERYVAEVNARVEIRGLDLDDGNVELIRATSSMSPRVTLERQDVTALCEPPVFDAVLLSDVLHHLAPSTHASVAAKVAAGLKPGGICVIKDLDASPRWKARWNWVHDRIVAGPEPIYCRPPAEMAAIFAGAGLRIERADRIDRPWTPYAHYIVRLRKPA